MSAFSDPFSLYQLAAWPAFILYVISYQILDPKKTIFLWIPMNAFMAFHFFGLGSLTAMAIALGAIARDISATYTSKNTLKIVLTIFISYVWIMALWLGNSLQDYLLCFATTLLSCAVLNRDFFWRYRLLALSHQSLCLFAFVLMGSYGATIQILFIGGSNIIGMIRKIIEERRNDHL